MAIETFGWTPDKSPSGEYTYRTRTAQFGDGYAQVVGDGINAESQSWPLTFTGTKAGMVAIRDFLRRHGGAKSFLWTPPAGDLGLYRCKTFGLSHVGGSIYTLNATFEQAFHP